MSGASKCLACNDRLALWCGACADDSATPRFRLTWREDDGPALWWRFPVEEPPYAGTPLDDDFPEHVTHWTPITVPDAPSEVSP